MNFEQTGAFCAGLLPVSITHREVAPHNFGMVLKIRNGTQFSHDFPRPFSMFQPILMANVNDFRIESASVSRQRASRDFFECEIKFFWTHRRNNAGHGLCSRYTLE